MKSEGPVAELERYPSESSPGTWYKILMGENEMLYCTCPAWRFQKGVRPEERSCKHLVRFKRENNWRGR